MNTKVLSKPSPIKSGTYKTNTKLFFTPSKLLAAQITELFDNVWPQVTAMKNLRWQVRGYYEENQIGINEGLSRKFVEPADKTNRPNLYRTCIEEAWEDQEYFIAKNLLVQTFACYEAWCDNILKELSSATARNVKGLQFPTTVNNLILEMQQDAESLLKDTFYPIYVANSKLHNVSCLENWLKVYRYFKECRNCIIHSGGIANDAVADAFLHVKDLSLSDLSVNEIPQMYQPVNGEYLELSLRGAVGFSQIVLRIVETIDIEFIQSKNAPLYFIKRLKETTDKGKNLTNKSKKRQKIVSCIQKGGFAKPDDPEKLLPLLIKEGVLRI